jgi:hypothetical protein
MTKTPDSPAQRPDDRITPGGNFWTLFNPGIWKYLHAVLQPRCRCQAGKPVIELSEFPALPFYSAFILPNRLCSTSSKRESFSESKRTWPQYFSVFSMSLL